MSIRNTSPGPQLSSHSASTESLIQFSAKIPREIVVSQDAAINVSQEASLVPSGPARYIISVTSERVPLGMTVFATYLALGGRVSQADMPRMLRAGIA
ncbi:hypothetical protein BGAL_0053g00010 [Botrytis galanthina]|uniref:Uncharacterized protein n=1 Tax=Botrytis galanthina TaxID=278940 RepID=A0A4S8RIA3_9HELO|nr:hypothetical protein BGAL_0053g00010 [Botrytis galanthina]